MDAINHFLKQAHFQFNGQENKILKFNLLDGSSISCIQWEGEHYITGMDIIRSLNYKLSLLGRQIINQKKLEEGIFSDLRNLKPNLDCKLELSHSNFLRFLHKNHCIRTMKKQKVFYFHAVPHDRMLNDILDRDIKRSALGLPTTTLLISNQYAYCNNGYSNLDYNYQQRYSFNTTSDASSLNSLYYNYDYSNNTTPQPNNYSYSYPPVSDSNIMHQNDLNTYGYPQFQEPLHIEDIDFNYKTNYPLTMSMDDLEFQYKFHNDSDSSL